MNTKHMIAGLASALMLTGPLMVAGAEEPAATQAQVASYSTADTALGELLDTPETRAVLEAHVSQELFDSPQLDMARGMTLRQLQPFATDILSDEVLAEVDADLAKLGS